MITSLRRWSALAAAAAYLFQGLLLLPLHLAQEAEPHDGCGACVHDPAQDQDAGTPSFRALSRHNHPLHDEHDCALCASAQRPSEPARAEPAPAEAPAALPVDLSGERKPVSRSWLLPDARAPPAPSA